MSDHDDRYGRQRIEELQAVGERMARVATGAIGRFRQGMDLAVIARQANTILRATEQACTNRPKSCLTSPPPISIAEFLAMDLRTMCSACVITVLALGISIAVRDLINPGSSP